MINQSFNSLLSLFKSKFFSIILNVDSQSLSFSLRIPRQSSSKVLVGKWVSFPVDLADVFLMFAGGGFSALVWQPWIFVFSGFLQHSTSNFSAPALATHFKLFYVITCVAHTAIKLYTRKKAICLVKFTKYFTNGQCSFYWYFILNSTTNYKITGKEIACIQTTTDKIQSSLYYQY